MENVEVKNEVVEVTTKKSKGFVVGLFLAATAAVGTFLYKRFRKNKVVEVPASDEQLFANIDIEEEIQ